MMSLWGTGLLCLALDSYTWSGVWWLHNSKSNYVLPIAPCCNRNLSIANMSIVESIHLTKIHPLVHYVFPHVTSNPCPSVRPAQLGSWHHLKSNTGFTCLLTFSRD